MLKITIWNEFLHERQNPVVTRIYPQGIHKTLQQNLLPFFSNGEVEIATATLDEPEHGLSNERLNQTDVLLWWGHLAHAQVNDEIVERVQQRVLNGMGLIVLHSGHASKIFRRLMGTGCMLRWREAGELERLWIVKPGHPITDGLNAEYFEIPAAEMYGEHFDIPEPDELIFISWFQGGEVFRSGCTFHRGKGKIFYFRPGHETYPIFHQREVLQVISNAARWAKPCGVPYNGDARHIERPLSDWLGLAKE
jgi:trehalose utilization protein